MDEREDGGKIIQMHPEAESKQAVRVEQVAQLFNLTVRRIQQLTQEGVLPTVPTPAGRRYELAPTIQRYIKYLSDKAYGKTGKTDREIQLREEKLQVEIELKKIQGEYQKIKHDIATGDYIRTEEVQLDYERFFMTFKRFAVSLPSRLSGILAAHCEPMEVRAMERDLTKEINRLLSSFVVSGMTGEELQARGRKKKKPDPEV